MTDVERSLPKYLEIANSVRDQIYRGDLQVGDEVPSERELAAIWHVARPTAGKAMIELRRLGLVESRVGAGSFVRASGATAGDRYVQARRSGFVYADNERAGNLAAAVVDAPPDIHLALSLAPGERAIRRARVAYRDDKAVSTSVSWFPGRYADVAPLLLVPERVRQGTTHYIEQCTGKVVRRSEDRFSARRATGDESRLLDLPRGAPVLCGQHRLLDAKGDVIEFGESVRPSGEWTSTFEGVVRP